MGNPIPIYYQIKDYIVVPSKNCIPFDWKDWWDENSKIIFRKSITVRDILKDAFGISNNEFERILASIEVNDKNISNDMILEKGLYKIRLGKRCVNLWYSDYEHTFSDYIGYYTGRILLKIKKIFKEGVCLKNCFGNL